MKLWKVVRRKSVEVLVMVKVEILGLRKKFLVSVIKLESFVVVKRDGEMVRFVEVKRNKGIISILIGLVVVKKVFGLVNDKLSFVMKKVFVLKNKEKRNI